MPAPSLIASNEVDSAGSNTSALTTASFTPTDNTTSPATYEACCLVGPGGTVTLTAGVIYAIHVKVTASPEIPVIPAGRVKAITP